MPESQISRGRSETSYRGGGCSPCIPAVIELIVQKVSVSFRLTRKGESRFILLLPNSIDSLFKRHIPKNVLIFTRNFKTHNNVNSNTIIQSIYSSQCSSLFWLCFADRSDSACDCYHHIPSPGSAVWRSQTWLIICQKAFLKLSQTKLQSKVLCGI